MAINKDGEAAPNEDGEVAPDKEEQEDPQKKSTPPPSPSEERPPKAIPFEATPISFCASYTGLMSATNCKSDIFKSQEWQWLTLWGIIPCEWADSIGLRIVGGLH